MLDDDPLSAAIDDLVSMNEDKRERATRRIEAYLLSCSPESLIGLEDRLRRSTLACYSWHHIDRDRAVNQHWPPFVWCLFSMHRNGYIREAAVRWLSSERLDELTLPYLLLRLNDWVPQVCDAARAGVRGFLRANNLNQWTKSLGLIQALRTRTRVDHSPLIDELTALYMERESESALNSAMDSSDRSIARAAAEIAMRVEVDRRAPLVNKALKSNDPAVRRMAAASVRNCQIGPFREKWLAIMHGDRFMPVRRLALLARIEEAGEARRQRLIESLLDSHGSIRQISQYYLSKEDVEFPNIDIRHFYLTRLMEHSSRMLKAAIAGLGETGLVEDVPRLKEFVGSPIPSVAATAVEAVASLAANENLEFFESLMDDPRPCVIRKAAEVLMATYGAYSVDRLRAVVRSGRTLAAKRWALRVLTSRHPFESFVDIVLAANHEEPAIRELAVARARSLSSYYRIPRGPSDAEVESVRNAIQAQAAPLPLEIQHIIHKYIGLLIEK